MVMPMPIVSRESRSALASSQLTAGLHGPCKAAQLPDSK